MKMLVPAPDRFNSRLGVELPQQTRQSGHRTGVGRHLNRRQQGLEVGRAVDDERQRNILGQFLLRIVSSAMGVVKMAQPCFQVSRTD